jgi:glycerophosphoryl diester phosphodiesterase
VFLQCFHDKTLQYLRNTLKTKLPLIQLIADNSWGEEGGVDYNHLMTPAGLDAVADYASGIGPWIEQIYGGKNSAGEPIISNLVKNAHAHGLQVHPYTFRRDELPEGIVDFDELLDIFINRAGIDGLFTDFPDVAYAFLSP